MEIARTMISSYNDLGYHAYNVSSHDFAGGLEKVRELAKMANFPFISANIVDTTEQKLLFKPYIIKKIAGRKFGIIGVTSFPKAPVKGIVFEDIITSLQQYLPEIQKQADFIILLGYLEQKDEVALFSQALDIDFYFQSGTYRYSRNLEDKKGMLVARCGNIGKYVGILEIHLKKEDQPLKDISNSVMQKTYAEKRLNSFADAANGKPLEEFYANDENILRTINSIQTQLKILDSDIQAAINPVTYDLIDLDESTPDDPKTRSMLDELEKKIGTE